ncbi:MAG TPA: UDP-N-acetylmuramoyl-L-alanyl-D-glutamate--2,6-diaminopimelate ligase [Solirubrobacteraceae bacterium]|nr:UDP-N-acetylmuramoyl-L-alanyl-D-glutamate--2,6-diaminopimelate ligase [Solirubrobacteraceae bacterium]
MRLAELLIDACPPAPDLEVAGLAHDTREVGPGTLVFCVPGFTRDGHDLASEAIARGAAALVVERALGLGVPEVVVPSVRAAMAPVAARFCGDPTARLRVVGVTGTNGKTTTAFLVRSLLEAGGLPTGLLGTVTSWVGGEQRATVRTTPEAIELQRTFAQMLDGGDVACAMEVSSHALELRRADAIHWEVAVFTNLTQDHLDFHGSMEDYFAAKRRLFEGNPFPPALAVVNVDDARGARLAAELEPARPGAVVTTGLGEAAALRATGVRTGLGGSSFVVDGLGEVRIPLPGAFNVANALGAIAAARALGVPDATIAAALPDAARVPGRFEAVSEGQGFAVIVDYSHTPDSLENVLRAARAMTSGRVVCVFGCGGDRDRLKRPIMGRVAGELADATIVTSDNPRSEDPEAIIADVLAGVDPGRPAEAIADRREAIERAIAIAADGDVVVIAGKGHERGQELAGGVVVPFDDVEVAREALRGRLVA